MGVSCFSCYFLHNSHEASEESSESCVMWHQDVMEQASLFAFKSARLCICMLLAKHEKNKMEDATTGIDAF